MPKQRPFPLYTRIFCAWWQLTPRIEPPAQAVWGLRCCQLVKRRQHVRWEGLTQVPCSHPLDVLVRVPEGTHELQVMYGGLAKAIVWPAPWERVHLVDKRADENRDHGLWWIGSPVIDMSIQGQLFV